MQPCQTKTATEILVVGQRVICNGYDGTVTKLCDGQLAGMCEVRLPGGVTCVDITEVLRFNHEQYRALK